ncbi:kinase-like domain-containing protein [Trametes punicea]|nr:kinase-like domain-containing protein [Trametes punicea]
MSDSTSDNSPQLAIFAQLSPVEIYWRDRQPFFAEHGYMLRPRYQSDWVPSWQRDPTIYILDAEDRLSMHAMGPHLMDARRISDNALVLMKRVRSDSDELAIATYLSSDPLRDDPRNHCVPILDVLRDPEDEEISFLVMPFLRQVDNPPFETVGTLLDCCEQLLEGLVFMHEHGVAHRDCAYKNVMMDATALYPRGFHPMSQNCLPDAVMKPSPVLSRKDIPVKYYYVDFGISTRFMPDDPNRLVLGTLGLDRDVPELSDVVPYDPFKVDVFILGNLIGELVFLRHTNIDMPILEQLLHDMLARNPAERPSAAEALERFREIRRGVSRLQAAWRPRPSDEPLIVTAVLQTASLLTTAFKSIFG